MTATAPIARRRLLHQGAALALAGLALPTARAAAAPTLLHAADDAYAAFLADHDRRFARHWQATTGQGVAPQPAPRPVALADVVALAPADTLDSLAGAGLLANGWRSRLPAQATPFTSTVVFVVRQGNPRGLLSWDDLLRPGVGVVAPAPRDLAGGRWVHLAAAGQALLAPGGSAAQARRYAAALQAGARRLAADTAAATTAFAVHGEGDVLLTTEHEAQRALAEHGAQLLQLVHPSRSVRIEPAVAWVDTVVERRGTRETAQAWAERLWAPDAQALAARHGLRPSDPALAAQVAWKFPPVATFGVGEAFGGWEAARRLLA